MRISTDSAIGRWLAESLAAPHEAWQDWQVDRFTMLPTGRRFDAVRMPGELVHAAIGDSGHVVVAGVLSAALSGPVVRDPRWYYALVPPRTTETWTCGLTRCLGRGAWLVVPRTDQTHHTGLHWCVPMTHPGRLCDPTTVAALISLGHQRIQNTRQGTTP
ncbi:hypothetical protein [Streptomyces sp. NPDC020965]|uniref:hypothetical protein n=1 Tax=Streptomyces sp. NPDC020965 TaxID=3365105 RepID=UPI0037A22312